MPTLIGGHTPALERRLPGAAARDRAAVRARRRVPLPGQGCGGDVAALGLLVRQLGGVAATRYERATSSARRSAAAVAETLGSGSRRRADVRARRRVAAARAATAPDPATRSTRSRRGSPSSEALPDAGLPGGVGRVGAHRDLGAAVPGALPALGARHVRRHGAARPDVPVPAELQAIAIGDAAIVGEPVRALQRAGRADPVAQPVRPRRSRSGTRTTTPATSRPTRTSTSSPASRSTTSSTRTATAGRTASRTPTSTAARPAGWSTRASNCSPASEAGREDHRRSRRTSATRACATGSSSASLTDEPGLHGWGEATLEWHTRAIVGAIEDLAELIVGEDPTRIEHLWQMMFRQHFWHGNGIVRGDRDERHRHRALGHPRQGARRALPPALGRAGARPRPPLRPPRRRADGGLLRERRSRSASPSSRPRMVEQRVHGLQVDGGAADDAARGAGADPARRALRGGDARGGRRRHRHHGRLPCPPEPAHGAPVRRRRSSRSASTGSRSRAGPSASTTSPPSSARCGRPIATGERLVGAAGVLASCSTRGACSVIQPDITHCGGLTEARRIAALAEAYRVALAPHNPQGPVSTAASIELGLATPSYVICEAVTSDVPWREEVASESHPIDPVGMLARASEPARPRHRDRPRRRRAGTRSSRSCRSGSSTPTAASETGRAMPASPASPRGPA